jgi:3-phenylpropionate/trans-cinnamate dioxygenase ferredoxin subunit
MPELVRVCRRNDMEPGTARCFDVASTRVALVRIRDDFFCVSDRCSHEDYSLSEGEVLDDECEIECWKHGSTFDLRTGEPRSLPATKPVAVYPIRIQGDDVMVEMPDDE